LATAFVAAGVSRTINVERGLMKAMPREGSPDAVTGCLESCRRLDAAIASVIAQDPVAYASIGPHLRHCLDHFQLFLDGWASGEINYDDRERDPRIERDPALARTQLHEMAARLTGFVSADLSREVRVVQMAAPGGSPLSLPSRLERELVFLSSHAIHHIAIMIFAAREAGVVIPAELGVAYSTDVRQSAFAGLD
jgi:uncharacterized damage-inducible protein DinB